MRRTTHGYFHRKWTFMRAMYIACHFICGTFRWNMPDMKMKMSQSNEEAHNNPKNPRYDQKWIPCIIMLSTKSRKEINEIQCVTTHIKQSSRTTLSWLYSSDSYLHLSLSLLVDSPSTLSITFAFFFYKYLFIPIWSLVYRVFSIYRNWKEKPIDKKPHTREPYYTTHLTFVWLMPSVSRM